MKAIKELKLRLPTERKAKGHSSTLNALKYALQCVKQVRGERGVFLFASSSSDPSLVSEEFEAPASFFRLSACFFPAYILYYIHNNSDTLTDLFLWFPANKEYYHQWSVEECHGCSLDLSAFTIEELDNITSEYTLKNTVSLHSFSLFTECKRNTGHEDL